VKVFSKSWVHPHDIQPTGGVEGGLGMTGVTLRRWLLGTALNMGGHEGNHVVERIYFHSCEDSWNHHRHNIPRDVARGAAAGGVAGMVRSRWLANTRSRMVPSYPIWNSS